MKVSLSPSLKKNPIFEDLIFCHQVHSLERIHTTRRNSFLMKRMKTFKETLKNKKFTSTDLTEQMNAKCTYFKSTSTTFFDLSKKKSVTKSKLKIRSFKACKNDLMSSLKFLFKAINLHKWTMERCWENKLRTSIKLLRWKEWRKKEKWGI